MYKKIISGVLAICTALTLTACGEDEKSSAPVNSSDNVSSENSEYTSSEESSDNTVSSDEGGSPTAAVQSDFEYERNDSGYTITKYKGNAKVIAVPAEINGEPVTEIASEAFWGCESAVEIQLPESVKTIYQHAFAYCGNLEKINIPDGTERLEELALYECFKVNVSAKGYTVDYEHINDDLYDIVYWGLPVDMPDTALERLNQIFSSSEYSDLEENGSGVQVTINADESRLSEYAERLKSNGYKPEPSSGDGYFEGIMWAHPMCEKESLARLSPDGSGQLWLMLTLY